jgi:hypothetical protein
MEYFCKRVFELIVAAKKGKRDHNTLSIGEQTGIAREPMSQFPTRIYNAIFKQTSKYIAGAIVDPSTLTSTMMRVTRVIPETTTRIDIYFLSNSDCAQFSDTDIIGTSNVIELYVRVLEQLAPKRRNLVEIVLLPTIFRKKINLESPVVLDVTHINSGVTFVDNFIFVYREEELLKVVLHELCHFYNFDFHEAHFNVGPETTALNKRFKVESESSATNEAYNDALTLSLYLCFYIAVKHSDRLVSFDRFLGTFIYKFGQMQTYVIKMSAKLTYYADRHFNGRLVEKTHVFAYYHCKAAMFANSRDMFALFNKQNYKQWDRSQIQRYIKLLYRWLDSNRYKHNREKYKAITLDNSDNFLATLKMCNFDIKKLI